MDPERRAEIIRETKENLRRYQNEKEGLTSARSAWPADATARSAAGFSSCRSADPPPHEPEDPIARWRAEGERFERAREKGRAEIRAQERLHEHTSAEFWQSVDARIAAAVQAEREFVMEILRDAIAAVNEIAEASSNRFELLDTKLERLSELLQKVREGTSRSLQRAREARADDDAAIGEVLPLVTKLN
jgi:hypothetical protein